MWSFSKVHSLEPEQMIEQQETLGMLIDNTSEEEDDVAVEEYFENGNCRRAVPVCLAAVLLISAAVALGPLSRHFTHSKQKASTITSNTLVVEESWLGGNAAAIASAARAPSSASASLSKGLPDASSLIPAAGSCSNVDQSIILTLPVGSGAGSIGLATYECFKQSWSFIGLVDKSRFSQCFHEKTRVSASCGSCYADYSKFGITHCAMECMSSWCSSRCLQCNSQYKATLDNCTGFVSATPLACDADASIVAVRKLVEKIDAIAA